MIKYIVVTLLVSIIDCIGMDYTTYNAYKDYTKERFIEDFRPASFVTNLLTLTSSTSKVNENGLQKHMVTKIEKHKGFYRLKLYEDTFKSNEVHRPVIARFFTFCTDIHHKSLNQTFKKKISSNFMRAYTEMQPRSEHNSPSELLAANKEIEATKKAVEESLDSLPC